MFYLTLSSMLFFGLGTILFFNYNRWLQASVVAILAAAYVVWAIIYHVFKKDFHLRLLWEYLVLALMASTTVVFLLWRS